MSSKPRTFVFFFVAVGALCLPMPGKQIFASINILFLVLGCFIDTIVLLLVVVPIVLPVAQGAGIDMVHLGVVLVLNMMIGLATPPFGMLLFTISGLTGTRLMDVVREMLPFLAVLVGVLLLCTFVPSIVLWLPGLF